MLSASASHCGSLAYEGMKLASTIAQDRMTFLSLELPRSSLSNNSKRAAHRSKLGRL
jgi:hypothetical protein